METLLAISGTAVVILIAIIGYFLRIVHKDVRDNTGDIGKLKGKTALIDQDKDTKHDVVVEKIDGLTAEFASIKKSLSMRDEAMELIVEELRVSRREEK